jgi:hypothetical protein
MFDPRYELRWLLVISGILGFRVGFHFAEWQVAVETAQVVAGLVHYPAGNPFYIYHDKLWTVMHQIGALALMAGVSEIALSKIISGLMDMMMFQGWVLLVYAFSRDGIVALAAAVVIFFSKAVEVPVMYPIFVAGTSDTYGAIGLWMLVLVCGLLGSGCHRSGAFLLGVAPAVHPSLGLGLGIAVAISILWDFRKLRVELRPALRYFLAGCAVTVLSLIVQVAMARDVPSIDSATASRYLGALVGLWDGHRRPVDMAAGGVRLNLWALALALLWLTVFWRAVPRSSLLLLRIVAVTAAMSVLFALLSRLPPSTLPATFLILMPTRLLNAAVVMFAALLFGLIGAYRRRTWSAPLLATLAVVLLAGNLSMLWTVAAQRGLAVTRYMVDTLSMFKMTSIVLVACAGWERLREIRTGGASAIAERAWTRVVKIALPAMAAACLAAFELSSYRSAGRPDTIFIDRTNDPLFARVAAGQGLLATGGTMHLIQLRTRRPVLIDGGAVDGVIYSIEGAPAIDRILRDVYGVDLFNPPREAQGSGAVPVQANQAAWAQCSRERWRELRRTYGITEVLTYRDWRLTLDPIAQNDQFVLYAIPE